MRLLGQVDYPLGVIAGDRFLDPLGRLLIPGPNDGRVSVERTRVAGMADHLTLHATHHGMIRDRRAISETIRFLRHGRFDRTAMVFESMRAVRERDVPGESAASAARPA